MSRLVIVVEKATDWGSYFPSENVVAAQDYLKEAISVDDERVQVINLCRGYKYLSVAYYCSLLAEARDRYASRDDVLGVENAEERLRALSGR